MAGSLSQLQVEAVYWIEQKFWETGSIITNEKLADHLNCSIATVKGWWLDGTFREALVKRGVDLSPETSSEVLTPEQLQLANILLNIHDTRSEREKLNEIGISSQKFNTWLRQPAFQSYLRKRAEAMFSAADYKAFQALGAEAAGGDVSALKLFFEMRGIYNPRVQVDVNIEVVLTSVVEIIAKHVKDPATLEAIATELDALETGGARVGTPALPMTTGGFEL